MNKNKFESSNDTRLAEFIGCTNKTVYETKLTNPTLYNNLKNGWEIKCLIPDFKVDTKFSELLPIYITEGRYELLWLNANKRTNEVLNAIRKAETSEVNPKMFVASNDTRMSLYIGCDKKTIYNTKSKTPHIYDTLKKGWAVKCDNPLVDVDLTMLDMFGDNMNPKWYELLMLGYKG